jgi:L-lactate dehydrogenase complex protein LldG
VSGAREVVLARIRAALCDVPADEQAAPPTAFVLGDDGLEEPAFVLRSRFAARVEDYGARVTRVSVAPAAIRAAVAQACVRHGIRRLAVPGDVPVEWLPPGIELLADEPGAPLSRATLDETGAVLTGCAGAIAQTGTIVLDGGPGQGRRALTLLADVHVCVVLVEQIVGDVSEALAAVGAVLGQTRRPVTLVSGPSATSDIELERVEGVHGPRRMEIVLAG